jgi:hypothetical protein
VGFLDSLREKKARIDATSARKTLEGRLVLARQGEQLAAVGNVYLFHDRVVIMDRPPVKIMLSPDTVARVDSGEFHGLKSSTRGVGAGIGGGLGVGMASTRHKGGALYLFVEDPAAVAMATLPPDQGEAARRLVVRLANAVIGLDDAKAAQATLVTKLEAELATLDAPTTPRLLGSG